MMKAKNKKMPLLKKLLKALPVVLASITVIYVGVLLKDFEMPVVMPVTDVQIQGELSFLNKEEIKLIVEKNITGGYFTVDLAQVRNVLLSMPWVKEVSLRRTWPASLNVLIEEQVPVAYWNSNAYLSEKGNVFKPSSVDENLNLPNLNGPVGQHDVVWKFMNVLYKETALLSYEVVRLDLDARRSWQMIVVGINKNISNKSSSNKIDVKLGRFDTDKRLQRFVEILPVLTEQKYLAKNNIKVIDMRYPNGFAVRKAGNKMNKTVSNTVDKNKNNKIKTLSLNLNKLVGEA